jgi:DNA-binding LytR/AlgR family response regulator
MLKMAICDDSLTDRVVLEKLIRQYGDNIGIEMQIDGFHSAELLIQSCKKEEYQLVFMDIFLGGMQGTEAARVLLQKEDCSVIFTTSSVEFALEGFEIGVLHYVVKPYSYEKIAKSMEKYVKAHYTDSMAVLKIKPVGNEPEMTLRQKDIRYIESFDKIRCIHLKNDDVKTYLTMNELCGLLLENVFCRPHRSYVVNLAAVVRTARNELELDGGEVIPVSRGAYDDVMEKYARFSG